MNAKFIELTLGNHIVVHGYNKENKEITEEVKNDFSKKLVAISRIKSVSKNFILTDYLEGRWIYWEYQESYEYVKQLLTNKI